MTQIECVSVPVRFYMQLSPCNNTAACFMSHDSHPLQGDVRPDSYKCQVWRGLHCHPMGTALSSHDICRAHGWTPVCDGCKSWDAWHISLRYSLRLKGLSDSEFPSSILYKIRESWAASLPLTQRGSLSQLHTVALIFKLDLSLINRSSIRKKSLASSRPSSGAL